MQVDVVSLLAARLLPSNQLAFALSHRGMALHRCLYLAAWLGFGRPELPWTGDFRDDNFLVTHGLSVDSVTLIAHILLVLHIDRPLRHLLVILILRHIDLNCRQV